MKIYVFTFLFIIYFFTHFLIYSFIYFQTALLWLHTKQMLLFCFSWPFVKAYWQFCIYPGHRMLDWLLNNMEIAENQPTHLVKARLHLIYQIHFALHYIPTSPSRIVSCHVTFCLTDRCTLKANYWFQRVRTSLLVSQDARVCACFNVFFCRRLPVCSCPFSYTSAVNLSLSPSLLHSPSLSLWRSTPAHRGPGQAFVWTNDQK